MSSNGYGYGRGYYGSAQLEKRSSSGWLKIAVVGGLGTAVWFLWRRRSSNAPKRAEESPALSPSPPPSPMPQPTQEDLDQRNQLAQSRGFSSAQAYEDSVVASARELQASGAKVVFTPYLQHLEARLGQP